MRMASNIQAIMLAVLCAAVAGAGEVYQNTSKERRAASYHHPHRVLSDEKLELTAAWKRSHWQKMQFILQNESPEGISECCPSVVEMVAPVGGKTPAGFYMDLYEDGENKQQLYELSCAPGVANQPCRFIDPRLYNQSMCVQKYSYSYALVRKHHETEETLPPLRHRREGHFSLPGSGGWSMDYVQVRAGCECQIKSHKRKNQGKKRPERHYKQKKRTRIFEEDDHT